MTLEIEGQVETTIPIEVEGIIPTRLSGLTAKQISALKIWHGRQQIELGQLFRVRGKIGQTQTIVWQGQLGAVQGIGRRMDGGMIMIEGTAGRHVASEMTGGNIEVRGDVGDFAGAEMRGGSLRIQGNAGDHLGGSYRGSKVGMHRGTIMVHGNAGRGVGQSMRRGFIAVAGNLGELCGWNMLAGTIVGFGNCGAECGLNMTRGTIALPAASNYRMLPNFSAGGVQSNYVLAMISTWLQQQNFISGETLIGQSFQIHHGDRLQGGRGEIFLPV